MLLRTPAPAGLFLVALLTFLLAPACGEDDPIPAPVRCIDLDGDGYGLGTDCAGPDCNDDNAEEHDNCVLADCADADGDGYGNGPDCLGPDCLDGEPESNPGAPEICGDGLDNDCIGGDAECNDGCEDFDRDGYGEGPECLGKDCDDGDPAVNPGADEICGNDKDDDCLGNGDAACSAKCLDRDLDGYGVGPDCMGDDCNDFNPRVFTGAAERCDFVDNDCDNQIDECPAADQVCGDDAECIVLAGGDCSAGVPCEVRYTCDGGRCRGAAGAPCEGDGSCVAGFFCDSSVPEGRCSDDPCLMLRCDNTGRLCDPEALRCVGCLDDQDCEGSAFCNETQSCRGPAVALRDPGRVSLALALVSCFDTHAESGERAALCGYIDAGSLTDTLRPDEYDTWLCDEARPSEFGTADEGERLLDRAKDLAGCGVFDVSETAWDRPIPGGSRGHMCIWFEPRSGIGLDHTVHVGECSELPEELAQ